MRTQEEIVARINEIQKDDRLFDFESPDLLIYLDFEHAQPFLIEGVTAEQWTGREYTREAVVEEIKEYLPFAFEKAQGERGLSAIRSQQHFRAWLWLAGDDDLLGEIEAMTYENYGIERLERIRAYYCPEMLVED